MILLKNSARLFHKIFCGRLYAHNAVKVGILNYRCRNCGAKIDVDPIMDEWVKI